MSNKRRVTLTLDGDLVDLFSGSEGASLSAAVNDVLRHAARAKAHRRALLEWLGELNDEYGAPSAADYAAADALLDSVGVAWERTP